MAANTAVVPGPPLPRANSNVFPLLFIPPPHQAGGACLVLCVAFSPTRWFLQTVSTSVELVRFSGGGIVAHFRDHLVLIEMAEDIATPRSENHKHSASTIDAAAAPSR